MSAGGSSGRSLGKLDIARREKVANTFGPGLSIRMEPIVLHKSKARNASPLRVARLFRYSSNLCFQQAACKLAVSVITLSRSSRTAAYRSRVIAYLIPRNCIDCAISFLHSDVLPRVSLAFRLGKS